MKTYIFLDVDGVLNTSYTELRMPCKKYCPVRDMSPFPDGRPVFPYVEAALRREQIEERFVKNLQTVCNFVESLSNEAPKIVISSDWRIRELLLGILLEELKKKGFTHPVFGQTPIIGGACRGAEIQMFLDEMGESKDSCNILIIDDRTDFEGFRKYLYQTSNDMGLFPGKNQSQIQKKIKHCVKPYSGHCEILRAQIRCHAM